MLDVDRQESGGTVTFTIADAGSSVPQTVILERVETETNNLTEPSALEKLGALLRRFFEWLGGFFGAGPAPAGSAEPELALIGSSLPRALSGVSAEVRTPVWDPEGAAAQVIEHGGLVSHPGLQRLIEEGPTASACSTSAG